ncbi:MAG: hypothetical protein LKI80_06715 [Sporolactobacillus sp.]|jgi:hypothetical protein|nr:hypothetical protein [Sporolactobacillus sp.]
MNDELLKQILTVVNDVKKDITEFKEETNRRLDGISEQVANNSQGITSLKHSVDFEFARYKIVETFG